MVRLSKLFGLAAVLWPCSLAAQTQTDLAGILARLERLERENRALTEEVRALRAKVEGSDPGRPALSTVVPTVVPTLVPAEAPAEVPTSPGATLEDKVEIHGQRIDEQAQTKVEASQKFPVQLAGMVLFNAFMNSKQNGGSDYPVTAGATGPARSGATMRQTVVGFEYRGPTTVWGGKVHGNLYMDFFAGNNNNAIRLRTGLIGIDWKNRSVQVGVEKPIFNPREPSSLAQVGVSPMTGSGNLWLWLPQVRVEQDFAFTRSTGLRAQLGLIQTREAGPYAGSNFTGTVEGTRPGLEGRFEFFHNLDEERRIEFATGFHTSQTHAAGQSVPSSLYSFDWFYNPSRRLEFTGTYYSGQNVAPLGAGYQQGFGAYYGRAQAVESRGGWGQVTIHALPRVDFHIFSGQQDDRDSHLIDGRIGKNVMYGGNLYYRLAPNVLLGLETTQLRTTYIGRGTRINNHYDLALAYLF